MADLNLNTRDPAKPFGTMCYTKPAQVVPGEVVAEQPNGQPTTVDWVVSPNITLRRDQDGHLYNFAAGQSNDQSGTVSGTQWRNDTVTSYTSMQSSYSGAIGQNITSAAYQNVYIQDTVTGAEYGPFEFTNWQGGGNGGGFTVRLADQVIPAQQCIAHALKTKAGVEWRDALSGVLLTAEQEQTLEHCLDDTLEEIKALLRKREQSRKCYERPVSFFDALDGIDTGNRPLTDDICVFPNESGTLTEIRLRVDNLHPGNAGANAIHDTISFFLNGAPLAITRNFNSGGPFNIQIDDAWPGISEYRFEGLDIPITAGEKYVITAQLAGGADPLIMWLQNDDPADGQIEYSGAQDGNYPALHWISEGVERFTERTYCDESVRFFDDLENEIAEIPGNALPIPCDQVAIPTDQPVCEFVRVASDTATLGIDVLNGQLTESLYLNLGADIPLTLAATTGYLDTFDFSASPDQQNAVSRLDTPSPDSNAAAATLNMEVISGFVTLDSAAIVRWATNATEGSAAFYFGANCGPLQQVMVHQSPVGADVTPSFTIPAGTHEVRFVNLDNGGSSSWWNLQVDDGTGTFIDAAGVIPGAQLGTAKVQPQDVCILAKLCCDGSMTAVQASESAQVAVGDALSPNLWEIKTEADRTVVDTICFRIDDPDAPGTAIEALKQVYSDGSYGEVQLLRDICPEAVSA